MRSSQPSLRQTSLEGDWDAGRPMLPAISCRIMPFVTAFQAFGEACVLVDEQPARQTTANIHSAIVYFMGRSANQT